MGAAFSGKASGVNSLSQVYQANQKKPKLDVFASSDGGDTWANSKGEGPIARAPDLTDQIIKSVAAAELKRKKVGSTRESMFVSERPSPAQMDADRKKNPALNQYTPKPKPPGGA